MAPVVIVCVGMAGTFIVPLDSTENKSNIANFFVKKSSPIKPKTTAENVVDKDAGEGINFETYTPGKRKAEDMTLELQVDQSHPTKLRAVDDDVKSQSPIKNAQQKPTKRTPPSVKKTTVKKEVDRGKITNFFAVK